MIATIRCICGAPLMESIGAKMIEQGITCWYCGRIWTLDKTGAKVTLLDPAPKVIVIPITDTEASI